MTFPLKHPNKITQGFKTGHLGIDIAPIPAGTTGVEVVSPENATVIASGNLPILEGQYLKLKGDSGMYYYFGHFAQRLVSINQRVSEGQAIGIMGMTGSATGIHTHHEVRTTSSDGQIDPIKFYEEGDNMQEQIDELNSQLNQTNIYVDQLQTTVKEQDKQLNSTNKAVDALTARVLALETSEPVTGEYVPYTGKQLYVRG